MDIVKSSLLNKEMRRKSQDSPSHVEVFVIESRGISNYRYSINRDKIKSHSKYRYKIIECYSCGKNEHIQNKGFQKKRMKTNVKEKIKKIMMEIVLILHLMTTCFLLKSMLLLVLLIVYLVGHLIVVLQYMSLLENISFALILKVNLIM